MHTIHNARIQLLATLLNNAALAFIVAGFIAPVTSGNLHAGWQVALRCLGRAGLALGCVCRYRRRLQRYLADGCELAARRRQLDYEQAKREKTLPILREKYTRTFHLSPARDLMSNVVTAHFLNTTPGDQRNEYAN